MPYGVPLTVPLEVAVRRVLLPGCREDTSELRPMRRCALATDSVDAGTLGVTCRGRRVVPNLPLGPEGPDAVSTSLLQEAGVLGPCLPGTAGQRPVPVGIDDIPGAGLAEVSETWQVTCGPESGHCFFPAGSLTLGV